MQDKPATISDVERIVNASLKASNDGMMAFMKTAFDDVYSVLDVMMTRIDERFVRVEERLDKHDQQFERIFNRLDAMDKRMETFEQEQLVMKRDSARYDRWINGLADKVGYKLSY